MITKQNHHNSPLSTLSQDLESRRAATRKQHFKRWYKRLLLCSLCWSCSIGHTDQSDRVNAENRLHALEVQMTQLKKRLHEAHDKQTLLHQEMAATEKQIGQGVKRIREIEQAIQKNTQQIKQLQHDTAQLKQTLLVQQNALAKQIRTRYQFGEYQPLKWLLNQESPSAINRLLTYYQYLIQSQQKTINEVKQTQKKLLLKTNALNQEVQQQQALQKKLSLHQQTLNQNQSYHAELIQSLNAEIQTKSEKLNQYEQDKSNLVNLLKSLSHPIKKQPHRPFSRMRHKLPLPIRTHSNHRQSINQGLLFFAPEGEAVTSVYPGRVVFSDWLRGYGLLLIIDHGEGYMTLYAHNQSLFKNKGEAVEGGEQIATIGHSGGLKKNGLYFEVRHKGKAMTPLEWLS